MFYSNGKKRYHVIWVNLLRMYRGAMSPYVRARDESAGTGSKFLGSGLSRVLYFGLGLVMGT